MSHFQNSVSFENGFRKPILKAGFSFNSKVAFSKTEVLKKPQIKKQSRLIPGLPFREPLKTSVGFFRGNPKWNFSYFNFPFTLSRCSLVNWKTTLLKRSRAIRFGIAIKPFKVSATSQTKVRPPTAPTIAKREKTTL